MHRTYLLVSSLLGALTVALGAFCAHGLKKIVDAETVGTFQTGVQYQMYHTLALLGIAIVYERYPNKRIKWAGACFITGIVFFSGSLYLLTALKASDQAGLNGVGIITPIGGLAFILGWIFLFLGIARKR